jgi:hypothetical protein
VAWPIDPGLRRRAAVAVVLSLVVAAAALAIYAIAEGNARDFIRTLQRAEPPDPSITDWGITGALLEALIALLLAAGVWFTRGRPSFAIAAIWSVLTLGTGTWIALATTPPSGPIALGPLEVSTVIAGVMLVIAAVSCLIASIIGWMASPSEPAPARPHMPPPTHQA